MKNYIFILCLLVSTPCLAVCQYEHSDDNVDLPDSECTTGDILPVTKDDICVPGYSKKVRNTPQSLKNAVLRSYGMNVQDHPKLEIDHLISLELGGSNDQKNLWPQLEEPRPGFHEKDHLENVLHQKVCSGEISLEDAQHMVSTDWYKTYKQLFLDQPNE